MMRIRTWLPALVVAALALFVLGTAWDVQWHRAIGRDRPLTPPHVLMLAGIALSGLASLATVLASWRTPSRGAVAAGFGALLAGIAFPLDDYWHTLYGIDVTLWAPFHVMIVTGMGMVGMGVSVQMASRRSGLAASLALTFATYLVLIAEAAAPQGLTGPGGGVALYPILLALALPIIPIASRLAAGSGTALATAGVFVAVRQALFTLVPWATEFLREAEGLAYRGQPPPVVITPNSYPGASLVLVALAVEIAGWEAERRGSRRSAWVAAAGAVAALVGTAIDRPWTALVPRFYPDADLTAAAMAALPWSLAAALVGAGAGLAVARTLAPVEARARGGIGAWARLAAAGAILAIMLGAAPVAAHEGALATAPLRAGPYQLEARYHGEPIGGRALDIEIVPLRGPAPTRYDAAAVPGPTTNAVPVRVRFASDGAHEGGVMGSVMLPVSGHWLLSLDVDGPLGPGSGEAPIVARPPAGAMPAGLAWAIGLLPVWSTLAFLGVLSSRAAATEVLA